MKIKRGIIMVVGFLFAVELFFVPGLQIGVVDHPAAAYFDKAITKGALAYGSCRAVNASVSVIKESHLQLEPAGVGMSLAVGQVLDPVDDMAERLSDVLVTALVSLGLQKLSYEILVMLAPAALGGCILLYGLLTFVPHERGRRLRLFMVQCLMLVIVSRFCLPLAALANEALYGAFFEPKIEEARAGLAVATEEMDKLKEFSLPEMDGFKGTIENSAAFLKAKSGEFKEVLNSLGEKSSTLIEHLLSLTFLYVGVFAVQVILLPLLIIWVLLKLLNALFYTRQLPPSSMT